MAGLVAYESSDEDEEVSRQPAPEPLKTTVSATADTRSKLNPTTSTNALPNPSIHEAPRPNSDEASSVYGPQMRPSSGPSFPPLEEDTLPPLPPGSPYTATRAMLRDLTLPAVPNMDIPPSPPGSPSSLNKKFENFLELKKKGIHFNSRIASNPSMKNPTLTDKLLAYAELDSRDQYETTLGKDIFNFEFPRDAFKERLRASQSEIKSDRSRKQGQPVEFEKASTGGTSTGKRKTRFDT
ncbi:hypothetical protein F5Y18DRAFT_384013 [Xylariaceae sp. FL1019]|nr:hypothetical protein F5Y18DRAFT_384013 [Xylariaceae sp. FL1019]